MFSKVLSGEIPENTVLSHDLLEGSYLRCGLASDIVLMDGYPTSYASFKQRAVRWIRGDFQIARWINREILDKRENKKKNPLNLLSKHKILDNLLRALTPIFSALTIVDFYIINIFHEINANEILIVPILSILSTTLIDIVSRVIYKKEGQKYQRTFFPRINSFFASIIRGILTIAELPDKAYNSIEAIAKTIYRMNISKKHLLEWTTSEEADKLAKTSMISYYKNMIPNIVLGTLRINLCIFKQK